MSGRSTTFTFIGQDRFSKVAGQVERKAGGMGSKIGKAGKVMAAGAVAAGAAVAGLAVAGFSAVKAAEEQATADARLAQVFKSMGYEDHAKAAKDYAEVLEDQIAVDAVVIEGAQAKLATFKDVARSEELMARSTRLAADMSAAGFGDMSTASVGLGKALQDPVRGMALLTRQGSLTADEQQKIAAEFERTGDKAAAQESILKALERQVGGVAEATANGSDKMALAFDDVKKSIGAALMPAFEKLVPVVQKAAEWFQKRLMPALGDLARRLLPPLKRAWDSIRKAIDDNRPGLEKLGKILVQVGQFIATKVMPAMIKWQAFIMRNLIKAIGALGKAIVPVAAFILRGLAKVIRGFEGFYSAVTGVLEGILRVAEKTLGWIPGIGDKVRAARAAFTSFRDHSVTRIRSVSDALERAADGVTAWDRAAGNARTARLKADISDATSKIAEARAKLRDPELTKTRRAELKAEIAQLREAARRAREELASVKDREVDIGVRITSVDFARSLRNRLGSAGNFGLIFGGMGPGPSLGDGGSAGASGLMAATHGAGSPGARFGQWGPYWSWNRTNGQGQHDGADIRAGAGTPVYATRTGEVTGIGRTGWAGNHVIWEGGGTRFIYAHLSSIAARVGQRVGSNSLLGRVGDSGNATGPHLHVQASRAGHFVDPVYALARGAHVKRRPGGTLALIGEGKYDEVVRPLKPGDRDGSGRGAAVVNINIHGGFASAEEIGRTTYRALMDYQRSTGQRILAGS